MRAKRHVAAIEPLVFAVSRPSTGEEARHLRGFARIESGDAEGAASDLSRLEKIDAGAARIWGIALVLSERYREGLDVFERFAGKSSDVETSWFIARALHRTGEIDEAERMLLVLAELYLTDGGRYRPEKAREYAELASGGGGQRYELLARAYRACGDVDMAAVTLEIGAEDDSLPAENRKRLRAILDVGGGAKPSGSDGVSSRP